MTRYIRVLQACIATLAVIFNYSIALSQEAISAWEDRHKNEPFILLLREELVELNKDYSSTLMFRMVAKITKEGGKNLGEIPIYYDISREDVRDIEAYTITPDGNKLRYEKIQELNTYGSQGMYSDYRTKMITMPNVVVGSIIEWKATIVSKKPVIKNHFYDRFSFGSSPVKEGRYRISAPKGTELFIKSFNTGINPKVETSGEKVIYTWEALNIDKIEMEEYMPSAEEVYPAVIITTMKDWKQMSNAIWPLFQKNLKSSPAIKKKVEEVTAAAKTMQEKIQAIIEYIQNDFRYVAMNIDFHNYEPHPVEEVFSNKYGDCKDHTLLAMSMLSEIGIKARPALISTSSEIDRNDLLPMPSYYDHVILFFELEGRPYYTDVLLKGYKFQEVPLSHQGKRIFVLNDTGGFFASIPFADKAETTNIENETVMIREDGLVMVEINAVLSRSISIGLKERFKKENSEMKEGVMSAIETQVVAGGKIFNKTWKNIDTPYNPISLSLQFENSSMVQRMGDLMMFGLPQEPRNALFSSQKRRHPIVFKPVFQSEKSVVYILPSGYEVVSLPKKVFIDTLFATYVREYLVEGSKVTGKEIYMVKPARIPIENYQTVRSFFDEITKSTNEKILIKKKG